MSVVPVAAAHRAIVEQVLAAERGGLDLIGDLLARTRSNGLECRRWSVHETLRMRRIGDRSMRSGRSRRPTGFESPMR
jgi:hypothetical protein